MSHSLRLVPYGLVALALVAALHMVATRAPVAAHPIAYVQIKDFTFTPHTLRVRIGTMVVWTNRDSNVGHTVTSGNYTDAHAWRSSGVLSQGRRFSVTFRTFGRYPYYCMPHYFEANMHGVVIVTRRP